MGMIKRLVGPVVGVGLVFVAGIIFGKTFDTGTLLATIIGAVGLWLLFTGDRE